MASDSVRALAEAAAQGQVDRLPKQGAGASDPCRRRARPAVLRRQEPRFLGAAVDRLERLFHPPLAVGPRQFDGRDVRRPYAAADRDRLFADPADGLALPPADHDAGDLDGDHQPRHRRSSPRPPSRSSRRGAMRPSSGPTPSRPGSNISARSSSISRSSPPGRRSITGSTITCCWKRRSTSALGWKARLRPPSWRCFATSSIRISCSIR